MRDKFVAFIHERERIRLAKEAGQPKPWTTDPVLQSYRFCNVNRNDDKVSRWIYDNWILPNEHDPLLPKAILLARMINWPDTLEEIGFPWVWEPEQYALRIRDRINRGEKTWTSAYMITAEPNGNPKEVSVCETVSELNFPLRKTCIDVWYQLQRLPRIGSFMAAQVVADLKRTEYLGRARDFETFCAPGPGSQKGLNLILNTDGKEWKQHEFQDEVNKLRDIVPFGLDAQNTQNCLCEFSKYIRGKSRSKYDGR